MFNLRHILLALLMLATTSLVPAQQPANENTGEQVNRDALEQIIQTLEDSGSRAELLQDLRGLRESFASESDSDSGQQSVLSVMGDWLETFQKIASSDETETLQSWGERVNAAVDDLREIAALNDPVALGRFVVDAGMFMGVWVLLLFAMMTLARRIVRRRGWPKKLPNEATVAVLAAHFARRFLPWALAFGTMLSLSLLVPATPGRTLILLLAYVLMIGRLLAVAAEIVFSLYTRGHRLTAVRILRQRALKLLFSIGALVALGDALGSDRLHELLGTELAELMLLLSNLSAALLTTVFVVRFKRPVQHLLVNRPYSHRHHNWSTADDVRRLLGNVWHIPALLLLGASLLAVIMEAGEPGSAITRAMFTATSLVLTLVLTRLARRHGERRRRRRRVGLYQARLEHFGYTLLQIGLWVGFAEVALQLWGMSILGIGDNAGLTTRFGQAALAVVITILLAWLVWILADTAIQRALTSSSRARGRQVNMARVQTITPMLRNILLVTVLIVAMIAVLANLGVNVTPLLAGAGVIGLALGFGAQTLVQDVITGIFILIEDSLAVGDFVEIGGYMGTVEGLTLRTVRLRDLDGILHIITFSQIQAINNMSRQFGIALLRVRVPQALKVDAAIELMREVATELRRDPFLGFRVWSNLEIQGVESFGEGGAVLRARMRTAPEWQWDVAREFNLRLKQRFEQQGIDIAAPRLSVQMETRTEKMAENPDADGREDAPPTHDATAPQGG